MAHLAQRVREFLARPDVTLEQLLHDLVGHLERARSSGLLADDGPTAAGEPGPAPESPPGD